MMLRRTSLRSAGNVTGKFISGEFRNLCQRRIMRDGGAVTVDDIDANYGFHSFKEAMARYPSLIWEGEPIRPDFRLSMTKVCLELFFQSGSLFAPANWSGARRFADSSEYTRIDLD
jgi:hypothetical protein